VKETGMTETTIPLAPTGNGRPRRTYAPPRLSVHGTVEGLTESAIGADSSGVPDGA
jgi:hypothetical protein